VTKKKYMSAIKPNPALAEITELANQASGVYQKLREAAGLPDGDGKNWDAGEVLDYGQDGVTMRWEYNWSFGGHSEGESFIPIKAILGSQEERATFIGSVVAKEAAERGSKVTAEKGKKKQARRKAYLDLKSEFE